MTDEIIRNCAPFSLPPRLRSTSEGFSLEVCEAPFNINYFSSRRRRTGSVFHSSENTLPHSTNCPSIAQNHRRPDEQLEVLKGIYHPTIPPSTDRSTLEQSETIVHIDKPVFEDPSPMQPMSVQNCEVPSMSIGLGGINSKIEDLRIATLSACGSQSENSFDPSLFSPQEIETHNNPWQVIVDSHTTLIAAPSPSEVEKNVLHLAGEFGKCGETQSFLSPSQPSVHSREILQTTQPAVTPASDVRSESLAPADQYSSPAFPPSRALIAEPTLDLVRSALLPVPPRMPVSVLRESAKLIIFSGSDTLPQELLGIAVAESNNGYWDGPNNCLLLSLKEHLVQSPQVMRSLLTDFYCSLELEHKRHLGLGILADDLTQEIWDMDEDRLTALCATSIQNNGLLFAPLLVDFLFHYSKVNQIDDILKGPIDLVFLKAHGVSDARLSISFRHPSNESCNAALVLCNEEGTHFERLRSPLQLSEVVTSEDRRPSVRQSLKAQKVYYLTNAPLPRLRTCAAASAISSFATHNPFEALSTICEETEDVGMVQAMPSREFKRISPVQATRPCRRPTRPRQSPQSVLTYGCRPIRILTRDSPCAPKPSLIQGVPSVNAPPQSHFSWGRLSAPRAPRPFTLSDFIPAEWGLATKPQGSWARSPALPCPFSDAPSVQDPSNQGSGRSSVSVGESSIRQSKRVTRATQLHSTVTCSSGASSAPSSNITDGAGTSHPTEQAPVAHHAPSRGHAAGSAASRPPDVSQTGKLQSQPTPFPVPASCRQRSPRPGRRYSSSSARAEIAVLPVTTRNSMPLSITGKWSERGELSTRDGEAKLDKASKRELGRDRGEASNRGKVKQQDVADQRDGTGERDERSRRYETSKQELVCKLDEANTQSKASERDMGIKQAVVHKHNSKCHRGEASKRDLACERGRLNRGETSKQENASNRVTAIERDKACQQGEAIEQSKASNRGNSDQSCEASKQNLDREQGEGRKRYLAFQRGRNSKCPDVSERGEARGEASKQAGSRRQDRAGHLDLVGKRDKASKGDLVYMRGEASTRGVECKRDEANERDVAIKRSEASKRGAASEQGGTGRPDKASRRVEANQRDQERKRHCWSSLIINRNEANNRTEVRGDEEACQSAQALLTTRSHVLPFAAGVSVCMSVLYLSLFLCPCLSGYQPVSVFLCLFLCLSVCGLVSLSVPLFSCGFLTTCQTLVENLSLLARAHAPESLSERPLSTPSAEVAPMERAYPSSPRAPVVSSHASRLELGLIILPVRFKNRFYSVPFSALKPLDLTEVSSKVLAIVAPHSQCQPQVLFHGRTRGDIRLGAQRIRRLRDGDIPQTWDEIERLKHSGGFLEIFLPLRGGSGRESNSVIPFQPPNYSVDLDWLAVDNALRRLAQGQQSPDDSQQSRPSIWALAVHLGGVLGLERYNSLHQHIQSWPVDPSTSLSPARITALSDLMARLPAERLALPDWFRPDRWIDVRVNNIRFSDLGLTGNLFGQRQHDLLRDAFLELIQNHVPELHALRRDDSRRPSWKALRTSVKIRGNAEQAQFLSVVMLLPPGDQWRTNLLDGTTRLTEISYVTLNTTDHFVEVCLRPSDSNILKALAATLSRPDHVFLNLLAVNLSRAWNLNFLHCRYSCEVSAPHGQKRSVFVDPHSALSGIIVGIQLDSLIELNREDHITSLELGILHQKPVVIRVECPRVPTASLLNLLYSQHLGPALRAIPLDRSVDPGLRFLSLVIGPLPRQWLSRRAGSARVSQSEFLITAAAALSSNRVVAEWIGGSSDIPFAVFFSCIDLVAVGDFVAHIRSDDGQQWFERITSHRPPAIFESRVPLECVELLGASRLGKLSREGQPNAHAQT